MKQNADPSPEQIRLACAEIQSTWSPEMRQRRLRADWLPMVRCADGRMLAVAADDYEAHHANHNLEDAVT